MKMNLRTDYALRMLMYLAVKAENGCTINDVADAYGLSRNHLQKVAQRLRDLGLVETIRGRTGGIRLARPVEGINLGRVVRAMEENLAPVECMRGTSGDCVLIPACRLRTMFSKAMDGYMSVLDAYTLADIVENRNELAALMDRGAVGMMKKGDAV